MYAAKGAESIRELLCDEWNADALATDKHRHMRASKWAYMAGHKALGEYLRKVQRRQVGPRKTYYKDHHEKLKPPRFKAQKPFVTKYPNVPRKCFCQNMPKPCSRCRKPEKWPHHTLHARSNFNVRVLFRWATGTCLQKKKKKKQQETTQNETR